MTQLLRNAWIVLATIATMCAPVSADSFAVTLDKSLEGGPRSGRLMLFVINKTGRRWERTDPMDAPFYDAPQPIASIAVEDAMPGDRIVFGDDTISVPMPLNELDGPVRVQAVLDVDQRVRSHNEGQGNLFSEPKNVTVAAKSDHTVELVLDQIIEAPKLSEVPNVKYVRVPSALLSRHAGHAVDHLAAVILPPGYDAQDKLGHKWAVVYVVPGFGGRLDGARRLAAQQRSEERALPAIHVLLDPDAPLGHHGFVDSQGNGPRATALVQELIPHLEKHFRMASRPEGRLLTGHSSGGWSTLWLQLNYPEVFGGTWSTAPDPIDFSTFGMVDLYQDENIFNDASGQLRPVYRRDQDNVVMTIKQETDMEWAMDPTGRSGQQWDTWESMFSPVDPETGTPKPLFDQSTGQIDRAVVEVWSTYDITRLVDEQWHQLMPVVKRQVHLICGDADSYYLERAVKRFSEMVQSKPSTLEGSGYVVLLEGADHGQAAWRSARRIRNEMLEHLEQARLLPNQSSTPSP